MLQSMILVAFPALVGLTAAFYVYYKISKQDPVHNTGTTPQMPSRTLNPSALRNRANIRQRNLASLCAICYDEKPYVELYPCKHKNICRNCTIQILKKNDRLCPFCRARIHGYS